MDMKDFIASLFLIVIAGLTAAMLLSAGQTATVHIGAGGVSLAVDHPAQAAAASPLPTVTPTPPTPIASPDDPPRPLSPAASMDPTAAGGYPAHVYGLSPHALYGDHLTYCYDPAVVWPPEWAQITRASFAAWTPTGLTFTEVAYSPFPGDCFILVKASPQTAEAMAATATTAADGVIAGLASSIGPLPGVQSWIWLNTAVSDYIVEIVAHEIGHILGLPDSPDSQAGIMYRRAQPGSGVQPGAADFAAVAEFWGMGQ